ncbi:hypothetical protein EVAR_46875_1 [Eumeta japonica]|uniref:DUF5641 domain-containing protein n=1 Tax=Eumeta variegata TaxID=151549 RepID=A0A4C1XMQ5_EUMVA|nr:hypothetical protein EVAR_46875_1 [Eumeta japonica]
MTDISDYIARLRSFVRKLQPSPASRHGERAIFVYKDLATTTHVFLREDTIRSTFQPAYTGPQEILKRGDKIFTILVNGKQTTVSIERIKPAYTVDDELLNTAQTATREPKSVLEQNSEHRNIKSTRTGRTVRFPDYYRP